MRAGWISPKHAAIVLSLAALAAIAQAEPDRSAAINQVTKLRTMAERSSAAFDQLSTVESGRSRVDQIDPALALAGSPDSDRLTAPEPAAPASACTLSPEQQSIVTSLEAQGKLPAGDCEMVAWFAQPGDKGEAEDLQSLAEAVIAGAPEMLGREPEADRLARLELEKRQAEAAASAAIALTILTPVVPVPPGK
ncbi:MAG: hypothetical protein GC196_09635 [Hyphomonas sp.]|nr:hypothetical protein [Hyphomonas sp.]